MTDRTKIGRAAKARGSSFERLISTKFAEEGIAVPRNYWQSQREAAGTGRARVPDIALDFFWAECGVGTNSIGTKKLAQAREDLGRFESRLDGGRDHLTQPIYPVSITRAGATRQILVTLSIDHLVELIVRSGLGPNHEVQIGLDTFIEIAKGMNPKERDGDEREEGSVWTTY